MSRITLVSVVIPSFNSAKTIRVCLESIASQTYKHIEIIVVDRGSRDATRQIAKEYTRKVYTWGSERGAQVNFGARKAHGKYIYRVDSDFIVEPTVVEECVRTCETNKVDGIAVHNTSAPGLGFWADVRKLERDTYKADNLIVAVRFFSKTAWKEIGGFDETLFGPEDYDFHNRFVQAGLRWGRIHAIERHLGEPKTIGDIWHKHFFYGTQMVRYFYKHPTIATKQMSPIRWSYLRHFWTLLSHPILTFGLLVMTAVKFTAGGLGFIYGLFMRSGNGGNRAKESTIALYRMTPAIFWFSKIRFWTGSFDRIGAWVPNHGHIIDLGCGYGILSNYLAYCGAGRKIIGVDLDKWKIDHAIRGSNNVTFRFGDVTTIDLPKADCIIIVDVLHHLSSYEAQEHLIARCFKLLGKRGKLIISDVDRTPVWKLVAGRLVDFVMYPGQPVYYRYTQAMLTLLRRYFPPRHIKTERIANTIFAHVLYICQA